MLPYIPKRYYDDVEFDLTLNVTNEKRMKAIYLEMLSNILATITNTYDPASGNSQPSPQHRPARIFLRLRRKWRVRYRTSLTGQSGGFQGACSHHL